MSRLCELAFVLLFVLVPAVEVEGRGGVTASEAGEAVPPGLMV
jgi:hypothetical protein